MDKSAAACVPTCLLASAPLSLCALHLQPPSPPCFPPPTHSSPCSAAKAEGNAAQAKGDFEAAIAAYTRAIAADPSDHVFFSNRSASFLSKGDAGAALKDAEECVRLNKTWSKGYGRLGAALFKLNRLEDAAAAFKDGLAVEASPSLTEGLAEVEAAQAARARRAAAGAGAGGFPGGFPGFSGMSLLGPDFMARVAGNPKFAPYLQDKAFVAKLMEVQQDPQQLIAALGMEGIGGGAGGGSGAPVDPRLAEVVRFGIASRGGKGGMGGGMGEEGEEDEEEEEEGEGDGSMRDAPAQRTGAGSSSSSSSRGKAVPEPLEPQAPPPPTDPETPEEREARLQKAAAAAKAKARKEEGNALYKAKQFDEALVAYREAAALDPSDMTYLLNEASVHFECKRWAECEAVCQRALDTGREVGAGYAVFAKCYARMGNSAAAQGQMERAIGLYESAQLEHKTEEVAAKLRKARADAKAAAVLAYQDPVKGAEAKERGNAAFKEGKWADAIAQYSDAIARDPSNPHYYQNRATAQAKVMNYGGAMEDCERALKLDPKFVKAMNRKGNCQVAMKDYHKAIETFRAALALEPGNSDSLAGMGLVQSKIREGNQGGAVDEERVRRAQEDPEIQLIMRDPMINAAIEDMQRPGGFQKVMADPIMKGKIEKLIGEPPGLGAQRCLATALLLSPAIEPLPPSPPSLSLPAPAAAGILKTG